MLSQLRFKQINQRRWVPCTARHHLRHADDVSGDRARTASHEVRYAPEESASDSASTLALSVDQDVHAPATRNEGPQHLG
jgi:hypothetical protein